MKVYAINEFGEIKLFCPRCGRIMFEGFEDGKHGESFRTWYCEVCDKIN